MVDTPLVKQLQAAVGLQATLADHLVIRAARSRHNYRRYLERALGVERGLEAMLSNITFDWDIRSRSKLSLISGDLLALGASVEDILSLSTCTTMRSVSDPIEAHCWLFVVERASTAHWAAYHQLDFVVREIAASYLSALLVRRDWDQVCAAFGRFSTDGHLVKQLTATIDYAMRSHYAWFAAAEDADGNAINRGRLARGSDNLNRPLDREAVPIAPSTMPSGGTRAVTTSQPSPAGPGEEPGDAAE